MLGLCYVIFGYYVSIFTATKVHSFYRQKEQELNLSQTFFPTLKNYYVNAKVVSESDYPWIAQVIHSRKNYVPFFCSAICIDERIFISAARCIYILKVVYTSLLYQNKRLTARAFVMPTKESKQMYDDIGFIIVNEFNGKWEKIDTYNERRSDNVFKWLGDMKFDENEHKVIGYAFRKGSGSVFPWKNDYQLTEIDVNIDIRLCRDILTYDNLITGFNVPCYHSCTYEQHFNEDAKCDNYHGSLGGAVMNVKSKKLFGVATWAAYYSLFELPVGFAIPNSESYFEDYSCALKIRNNNDTKDAQKLCDASKTLRKKYINKRKLIF